MITLNLLSPFKKKRLGQLIKFLFIKEILEIITFAVALLAVIHLAGFQILNNFLTDLSQSTTAINKDFSEVNREIARLNLLVRHTAAAGTRFAPLSPHIVRVIQLIPSDIKLNSFDINRATQELTLSGTAATRDALIRFQESIQKEPWIANASTPVSGLFQKTNINFEIKTKLLDIAPLSANNSNPWNFLAITY